MATRNDIIVEQRLSPRVAEVRQPSDEVVMQDYVDTLRIEEERFQSMGFERLIDASGKQDLGGGVLVGITVEENNVQLAFEPNTTPAHIGSVTTPSGPPNAVSRVQFVDTTADFVTAEVQAGSMVINFTDNSIADVVRVINSTTLECRAPSNGSDNEFDLADVIHVFNIRQCRTSGGNLVAKNDVGATIPAVLPTAFTQVVLTTSSSATIQELGEIRFSAYGGGVTLDPLNPNAISGTEYPAGTMAVPSDNWADALTIHDALGVKKIFLNGDNYVVPASTDLSNNVWIVGSGATVTHLTIPDSANTANLRIQDCFLESSWIDDANLVERSLLNDCYISGGYYFECAFTGTSTMTGAGQVNIYECYSGVAGAGPFQLPVFDVGLAIVAGRGWTGGAQFEGKTGTGGFSWDMDSGRVIVADDNTTGTMTFRGHGLWENEDTYAGTATVDNQMSNDESMAAAVWNALVVTYSAAGSFGQLVGRKLLTVAKFFGLQK
jgi:hypothetical protein